MNVAEDRDGREIYAANNVEQRKCVEPVKQQPAQTRRSSSLCMNLYVLIGTFSLVTVLLVLSRLFSDRPLILASSYTPVAQNGIQNVGGLAGTATKDFKTGRRFQAMPLCNVPTETTVEVERERK
jgi:hypothetical protein